MLPVHQNNEDDDEDFELARRMAETLDGFPEDEYLSAIANVLAYVLTRTGEDRTEAVRSCDAVIRETLDIYDTNAAIRKAN